MADACFFAGCDVECQHLRSGLVVFTRCAVRRECRVSFAIPRSPTLDQMLVVDMCLWCESNPFGAHYAFDTAPCRTHTEGILVPVRMAHRLVPHDVAPGELTLCGKRLCLNGGHHVDDVEVIGRDAIGRYRPLRTMSPSDIYSQRYWTQLACGKLVAFANPTMPMTRTSVYVPPPFTDGAAAVSVVGQPWMKAVVEALFCGRLSEAVWRMCVRGEVLVDGAVAPQQLPMVARALVLSKMYQSHGLGDDVLLMAARMVSTSRGRIRSDESPIVRAVMSSDLKDLIEVGACLEAMRDGKMKLRAVVERLRSTRAHASGDHSTREAWERWSTRSALLGQALSEESAEATVAMARVWWPLWTVELGRPVTEGTARRLARLDALAPPQWPRSPLRERLAKWRAGRAEKALHRRAEAAAAQLVGDVFAKVARALTAEASPEKDAPPAAAPRPPHEAVLASLRARLPAAEWHLIGSGKYVRASDVDLVAVGSWDEASLSEAYAIVARAVGLRLVREAVDEHRVNVLHGVLSGVSVDLQVVRRGGETHAEGLARSAVQLSERLSAGMDSGAEGRVGVVHDWFRAARMKGNVLCRLPGIAVTCIAVVLGSEHANDAEDFFLPKFLQRLRERLCAHAPVVSLEEVEHRRAVRTDAARPSAALRVYERERNLAQRHAAVCTRHLLDMVAFACSLQDALQPVRYDEWRRRHMFRAAKVAPRHASALAKTLHVALADLSRHPLLDSVFVDEGADTLTILCTLRRSADPKYEMGADAAVARCHGEYAYVRRARKTALPVMITRGMVRNPMQTGVSAQVDVGDGGVIPNAPTLTTDVCLRFPSADWSYDMPCETM